MMMTEGFLQLRGFKPKRAHAAGHNQADVGILQLVGADGCDGGLAQLGVRHGDVEQQGVRGIKQTLNVFLELEHAAIVGADAFKNAVTVEQAVVEDRHFGIAFAVKLAVDKNFHVKAYKLRKKKIRSKCEFPRDKWFAPAILHAPLTTLWSSG